MGMRLLGFCSSFLDSLKPFLKALIKYLVGSTSSEIRLKGSLRFTPLLVNAKGSAGIELTRTISIELWKDFSELANLPKDRRSCQANIE